MLDQQSRVIYVGKAHNLRARLRSYFSKEAQQNLKTRQLVARIASIDVTVTSGDSEALLLENNLIKRFQPRYNVLFRDDKSYPYICLDTQHEFPRLRFYRGPRRKEERYFGPYTNVRAVRQTLGLVQKLFRIRNCEDSVFRNRVRPCLQYQIQRCRAPCVNWIDAEQYRQDLEQAVLFLEGRNETLTRTLQDSMQQAASRLDFEQAARYRDLLGNLSSVQGRYRVSDPEQNLDLVACCCADRLACVQVFNVRHGMNLGNRAFFPRHAENATPSEVLAAFLSQYYLAGEHQLIPAQILLSHLPDGDHALQQSLAAKAGHAVRLQHRPRGELAQLQRLALENAAAALTQRRATAGSAKEPPAALSVLQQLADLLQLSAAPAHIECFDISHTRGEAATASCVVFVEAVAVRSAYRRFNMRGIRAGDDYAAIGQAVQRRYRRLQQEQGALPDLLLIDGGRGQLNTAQQALDELGIAGLPLLGISKGPGRKAGLEALVIAGRRPIRLPADSPVLHLLQRIRDEAHRFALSGHRQRRRRSRQRSALEVIEGVGEVRRRHLLQHFGGLRKLLQAGAGELARAPGIGPELARRIYEHLH